MAINNCSEYSGQFLLRLPRIDSLARRNSSSEAQVQLKFSIRNNPSLSLNAQTYKHSIDITKILLKFKKFIEKCRTHKK